MMAHEMPIGMLDRDSKPPPKNKERYLPNGQKVDFGNGKKADKPKRNKKDQPKPDADKPQALPNGAKPVFHESSKKSNNNSKNQKKKKDKKPEDAYAGSSFHSSPEALNLPKPSFKSPKSVVLRERDEVSSVSPPAAQHMSPPQHPVTAYPPGSGFPMMVPPPMNYSGPPHPNQYVQPGFQYQFANGNLMYQYPDFPPPRPGYPVLTSHFQPGPVLPNPAAAPPANVQGQKISFNDLLGSSQ